MKKRTIVFSLMATLITLSLVFTGACGGDEEEGKPKPGSLKDPQEITLNLGGEVVTIDPNRASWSNERSVMMQVFDGLLAFDHDLKLVPMVAKEIPTVANKGISADGLTYTIKLRTDVTWSDGTKVTAKDFVFSIKRLFDPDLAAEYASMYCGTPADEDSGTPANKIGIVGAWECFYSDPETEAEKATLRDAIGVRAKDEYTLEIKLRGALPTFLPLLALWPAYPIRQDMVEKYGEAWAKPDANGAMPGYIGNGPFVLKEWVEQDHYTFVPNENYWGTKPYLTKITYKIIQDAVAAVAAYQNDELDQTGVVGGTEKTYMDDPVMSKQIVRGPVLGTYALQFNVTKEPFKDNKFLRQAIATAFDRVTYIDKIRGGVGKPATSWIPPGMTGYDPELGKEYTFNPTKAKELLAQAGYPDPKTLKITFQYSNTGTNPVLAAFLQEMLVKNLGIDLTLEPMDSKAYSALYNAREFKWGFTGWGADYPDPENFLSSLYMTGAGNNKTSYSSAEYDAIAIKALKELDETKRLQLWADAHALVVEDCPMCYVFFRETFVLKKSWVKGQFITGMDGTLPGDMFLREVYIEK